MGAGYLQYVALFQLQSIALQVMSHELVKYGLQLHQ